jgi:drug/metabolite transporter (DMT)-like permease
LYVFNLYSSIRIDLRKKEKWFQLLSAVRYLMFAIAIICLSQAGNFARYAAAPVEVIGFWRLIIASIVMYIVSHANKSKSEFSFFNFSKNSQASKSSVFYSMLSGSLLFVHLWCFMWAAQNTKIAHLMIIFATNPIFTAFASKWVLKQKLPDRLGISYTLAMLGLLTLVAPENIFSASSASDLMATNLSISLGDISALFAALFYSGYMITGHLARRSISNANYTFIAYGIASILFGSAVIFRDVSFVNWPINTWLGIAGVTFFSTLLGHATLTYLLKFININIISTAKLSEPVMATTMAWILFDEIFSFNTIIAFCFTVTGLIILFKPWQYWQRARTT